MESTYTIEEIQVGELMPKCAALKSQGWRLCQIHAVRTQSGYELTYTLAKDYDLHNYKLVIGEETVVPSITPVYSCAFLYENEIAELFGVNIENILMSYDKKLYKLHVETPFK